MHTRDAKDEYKKEYKKKDPDTGMYVNPNRIIFCFNSGDIQADDEEEKEGNRSQGVGKLQIIKNVKQGFVMQYHDQKVEYDDDDDDRDKIKENEKGSQSKHEPEGKDGEVEEDIVEDFNKLNSFSGSKIFMAHYKQTRAYWDQKPDLMNLAQQGKSATKRIVLATIMKQLMKYEYLENIMFYYNGHGVSSSYPKDKYYCGKWFCEDNELIGTEELLEIIRQKCRAGNNNKRLNIVIYSDCCGSAGQYWQIIKLAEKGSELCRGLQSLLFYAPCDYYQDSYGTMDGGMFTQECKANNYYGNLKHMACIGEACYACFIGGKDFGYNVKGSLSNYYLAKAGAFIKGDNRGFLLDQQNFKPTRLPVDFEIRTMGKRQTYFPNREYPDHEN